MRPKTHAWACGGADKVSDMVVYGKARSIAAWCVCAMLVVCAGCGDAANESDGGGAAANNSASSDDACAEASRHLAACFEQEVEALPTECDAAQAERILGTDCDTLNTSLGKADAWWCTPWTPPWVMGCGGGFSGNNGGTSGGTGEVLGGVDFSWDNLGSAVSSVSCALVVLTDAEGAEVGRAHTSVHGGFAFDEAVEPGEYTVTVYDRYGEDASNIALKVNGEPAQAQVTVTAGEESRVGFTLAYHRDGSDQLLGQGETTEDAVERCTTVRNTLTMADACGAPIAPYREVDRDWVGILTDADGASKYATVWCQPADGDHWSWDGCQGTDADVFQISFSSVMPGAHTLTFVRVDLPDRNNLDYEDELSWRTQEAHPEAWSFAFDIAPDGKVLNLDSALDAPVALVDPWDETSCP